MEFDLSRWSLKALFQFRSKVQGQEVRQHRVGNPYHAVSIVCGPGACNPAKSLGNTRFLSSDAPHLPLEFCTAEQCRCRYRHHEDRRRGARRSGDESGVAPPWSGPERRKSRGRRATDA